MKASKFTEAQIAIVLKQAEGSVPIADVRRKAGSSDATFYNGRKKYAGLMPSEMKRLRQLEDPSGRFRPRIVEIVGPDRAECGQTSEQHPLDPEGRTSPHRSKEKSVRTSSAWPCRQA